MDRLTEKHWRNLDPWECCGQDNYCKRGCHETGGCNNGCIVPKIYTRLAKYEDTGLKPEEINYQKAQLKEWQKKCGIMHRIVAELREEIKNYRQWVNDLQSGMYVNCVYCGHRYGPADNVPVSMADVLKEHVGKCSKHPMSLLKAELERVKKERDAALEDLNGHCEYCAFRNDCAKHDNNGSDIGFTWWTDCEDWEWYGAIEKEEACR